MTATPHVTVAVEGDLDERVALRLVEEAGGAVSRVHGKRGKPWLQRQIGGYRNAARYAPWLVLVDLDRDLCAPGLRRDWGVDPGTGNLCFRVAVRSIESWLLADSERLASFLGIARRYIPREPDAVPDAKRALIEAAARSRRKTIRDALVPLGSARIGPLYTGTLVRFVDQSWNPVAAAATSPSLAACRTRLAELLGRLAPG